MLYAASSPVLVDSFPAYDLGSVSALVLSLALMGLFWLPGFLWASWLHRRERFHWTFRCLAGFGWSMALFAACTWPFLWYKLTMTGVLQCVGPVWVGYCVLGLWCGWRLWQQRGTEAALPINEPVAAPLPPDEPLPMSASGRAFLFRLCLYIAVCLITAYVGAKAVEKNSWNDEEKSLFALLLGGLFAAGWGMCWWGRRVLGPWTRFTAGDDLPPSPWLHRLAVGFVLLQAGSAVIFDRCDWDDCYYCALMLDYAEVDELNRQEPTHREGFHLEGHNRVLVWELWGGVLCKLSGLNPQALCHTLWAGLLALLAFAGYWQVVKECVPRRWVPLTMLGVGAFFFWGISSHHVMSNYLLVRLWQGKATLIHLGFPLLIVAQLRYVRRPTVQGWLLLLAAVVFALAASSSGIFLAPMLCSALCWSQVRSVSWRQWWGTVIGCILALVPAVAYGLLIRSEVLQTVAIQSDRQVWDIRTGFAYIAGHVESGSWEMVWFLLLPVLALLLPHPWSIYPVFFSGILMLTWANPALCDPIAQTLTNYWTYFRIYWMLPVWIGIGLTLTLLGRICALAITQEARRWEGLTTERVFLGLLVSFLLPATYVWGSPNLGFMSGNRPHFLGRNLMKMPLGLKEAADFLLQDPEVRDSKVRLLCLDPITNYLTPYDRRFRFVITRELYTLSMADQAGRTEEGIKRHWLGKILYGYVPQEVGDPPLPEEQIRPEFYHRVPMSEINKYNPLPPALCRELLNDLQVKYVVTTVAVARWREAYLQRAGFRLAGTFGQREQPADKESLFGYLHDKFFGPPLEPGEISPLGYQVWVRDLGPKKP